MTHVERRIEQAKEDLAHAEARHGAAVRIYRDHGEQEAHRLVCTITWREVRGAENDLVLATARGTAARWRRLADEQAGFLPLYSARLRAAADEVDAAVDAAVLAGDVLPAIAAVTRAAADLSEPQRAGESA